MTEPQPQPQPYGPPNQLGQPVPPKKKKSKLPWILGGVAMVLLLCFGGCGAILAAAPDQSADKGKKVESAAPAADSTTTTAPAPVKTTAAAPKYGTPKPADFKLTVKELDKQCFGSAGCNLEFRVSKVSYTGPDLDPSATYEISYAYKGLSDPMTGTFELTGDGSYEVDETEYGQTSNSSKKVTAVVTAVEKM